MMWRMAPSKTRYQAPAPASQGIHQPTLDLQFDPAVSPTTRSLGRILRQQSLNPLTANSRSVARVVIRRIALRKT
jgi:hypothetical protein